MIHTINVHFDCGDEGAWSEDELVRALIGFDQRPDSVDVRHISGDSGLMTLPFTEYRATFLTDQTSKFEAQAWAVELFGALESHLKGTGLRPTHWEVARSKSS